ncbi:MAG: archaeosine synthase subunit alpha [Methanospirillum sp.]
MKIEIRARDGLARGGTLVLDDLRLPSPAAAETAALFPSLGLRSHENVPLAAGEAFVRAWLVPGEEPHAVHPASTEPVPTGAVLMVANWHTALADPAAYVRFIVALKERLPLDAPWYAPAAALPSNAALLAWTGFDLFDYTGPDLATSRSRFLMPEGGFSADALESGVCSCPGCAAGDLGMHNRLALDRELALVRRFVHDGRLRDLVDARCRLDANLVAVLRLLDRRYAFVERWTPVTGPAPMRANSAEALGRPEVRRFAERVLERYRPARADTVVLLPCSARKPYSLSRSHALFQGAVRSRAHELIVTSPLGIVPRELELCYPAAHYDVPVTGYWDAEEVAVIAATLAAYLSRHGFSRVIAHLEGGALRVAEAAAREVGCTLEPTVVDGRPTSDASLALLDASLDGSRRQHEDPLRGLALYQFDCELTSAGLRSRGRYPNVQYLRGRNPVFGIDAEAGLLRPTFEGWSLLGNGYRVEIDDFVPQGDVLAPGVLDADPRIRPGDEVLVVGPSAYATGRAAMSAGEMLRSTRGVAVRRRKVMKREREIMQKNPGGSEAV